MSNQKSKTLGRIRMEILKYFLKKQATNRFSFSPQISDEQSWNLTDNVYSETSNYRSLQISYSSEKSSSSLLQNIDFFSDSHGIYGEIALLSIRFFGKLPSYETIWEIRRQWIDENADEGDIEEILRPLH